mmetsp:Transcript_25284/g.66086  ORF Transcript_25284/g.66086 Transcript_25284/m.66086 type:complete len:237 (-) Transcript_25284:14-724(-)
MVLFCRSRTPPGTQPSSKRPSMVPAVRLMSIRSVHGHSRIPDHPSACTPLLKLTFLGCGPSWGFRLGPAGFRVLMLMCSSAASAGESRSCAKPFGVPWNEPRCSLPLASEKTCRTGICGGSGDIAGRAPTPPDAAPAVNLRAVAAAPSTHCLVSDQKFHTVHPSVAAQVSQHAPAVAWVAVATTVSTCCTTPSSYQHCVDRPGVTPCPPCRSFSDPRSAAESGAFDDVTYRFQLPR